MFRDRVILICTLLGAAAYFYGTSLIPSLQIGDPLGPKAFPYLIGIGLLVSAGWLLLEIVQAGKAARAAGPAEAARPAGGAGEDRRHLILIAAVSGWIALYFAAFERLGFLLATPVFLLVLMAWFNRGRWLANVLTAVLFSVGVYLLFSKALGVTLAKGLLPF